MEKNHYEMLEINKTATQQDIKNAYKKLSLMYHPDKNKDVDAQEKFTKISNAYKVLSDENSKRIYDHSLRPRNPLLNDDLYIIRNTIFNNTIFNNTIFNNTIHRRFTTTNNIQELNELFDIFDMVHGRQFNTR